MTSTPKQDLIAEAKALGETLLLDAKNATIGILTSLGTDTEAKLPIIESKAELYALSFVPESFRTEVATFADTAMAVLAPESVKIVKAAWGAVLLRIEGAFHY